jgi:hypothetical protein
MRDGKKKKPLHVSDATSDRHRRRMSWMWRHSPRRLCTLYIVFAGSISINKKRITSNYSTIRCRNSPHRQLEFSIGHNSSLIAILRIHVSAFNAHWPSGAYQPCH